MESLSNRSEYSDLLPLKTEFVLNHVQMTWPEILWAYSMGLIGWRSLKEFAQAGVGGESPDDELVKLANLSKECASSAEERARSLATHSGAQDEVTTRNKWLYLLLKSLYEQKGSVSDPLGLVEQIYADFDYPERMEGFVRWMPTHDPVRTPEEAAERMDRNWQSYLENRAAQFRS